MSCGDLELVCIGVSGKLDDLHSVEQRLRDRIDGVCGTDKEHIRQIVRDIHIVVCKGMILLRVQHLQKGARRISVVGRRKLIHLIQHHHRV